MEPIFHCEIPVSRHPSQKNEKIIQWKKGSHRPFIGSTSGFKLEKQALLGSLLQNKLSHTGLNYPISFDIHVQFIFYFTNYYTKLDKRNQKIPDLSNLYHFPEDCLQEVGIIQNDSFICSHDGSRRLPSIRTVNVLDISIWPFIKDAKPNL